MSAPSEVIKDTIGVGGYQRSVEDYQRFVEDLREGQGSRAYKVGGGLISGFMQASMPLFFRQFELALSRHEEEMPVRKTILSALIDLGAYGVIFGLASLNPQETLPIAVGGKVIYNAAASATPRAFESLRTRRGSNRTA